MPAQFTMPPDTRSVGSGNPPADMNAVVDALTASGTVFNVLNAAYAGGADPTGVNFSDAAFQACLTAATGTASVTPGEMVIPPGVYKLAGGLHLTGPVKIRGLGPANGYNSVVTGLVTTLPSVTLNCAASTYLFNMPAQGYLWGGLEMSGLNINFTGTGNVFDSVNFADSAFRDMTITLTQSGSQVMTCSGSNSVLNVIHERCTFVTTNAVRSQPMFSIASTIGAGISNNTFFKCKFSNAGQDNTQYMIFIQCTGTGTAYHVADNIIECWFEHPFGGIYKSLSGSNIKVDGCVAWDVQGGSPLIGNSLYYFGAAASNAGSQSTSIINCGRNLNGPDGTATNKWDVECESTSSGVLIQNYITTTLNPTTTYNVYFNFHGCQDVVLINNQSPQGSSVNGNSTTVVTNPSPGQIALGDGNIYISGGTATGTGAGVLSIGDAATAPTTTPVGGGLLYGAGGAPLWLDTAGKFWNLAQGDVFDAADANLLAWNYDPAYMNATAYAPASGTVQAFRINIRRPMSVTNVIIFTVANGVTLTAAQSLCGLWTSAGARIGITADQSGSWVSGAPTFKTMALASGPFAVTPPFVWLLFLCVGTTPPTLGRLQSNWANGSNANLSAANSRWATGAAGQTALPAGSITPSTYLTGMATQVWAGVS
jgi:hypothetical protein